MGKLSDSEKKEITKRIRGLGLKDLQVGISTSSRVICHNCGYAKLLAGSIHYGQYRLCNDCALNYELAKAEGAVQTIEDFVLNE
jgi:predicted nucleic acid binding AN1-type Zn finger protein